MLSIFSGVRLGNNSGKRSSEEHSPTQLLHNELVSTEELEQNLTPQFKKKLHKWRAKHQNANCYASSEPASSPTAKSLSGGDLKPKIDWNLWSSGALKLEGQGLCALPDQKDLPEKFQKKLGESSAVPCEELIPCSLCSTRAMESPQVCTWWGNQFRQ